MQSSQRVTVSSPTHFRHAERAWIAGYYYNNSRCRFIPDNRTYFARGTARDANFGALITQGADIIPARGSSAPLILHGDLLLHSRLSAYVYV